MIPGGVRRPTTPNAPDARPVTAATGEGTPARTRAATPARGPIRSPTPAQARGVTRAAIPVRACGAIRGPARGVVPGRIRAAIQAWRRGTIPGLIRATGAVRTRAVTPHSAHVAMPVPGLELVPRWTRGEVPGLIRAVRRGPALARVAAAVRARVVIRGRGCGMIRARPGGAIRG